MGKLYDNFLSIAEKFTEEAIEDINDALMPLKLEVYLNENYEFSEDDRWLAVYIPSELLDEDNIEIAVNYPLMFSEMKKRRIHQDKFNIEAQCRINVAHEAGHGLVDWLRRNLDEDEVEPNTDLGKVYYADKDEEEEIVEEFGQSFFPEATRVYSSLLEDVITEVQDKIINI